MRVYLGPAQILLNAGASCSRKRPVWEDGVLSEANEIINTNVMGSFRVVREAMRHLSNTQGDRPVWILLTEGQGERMGIVVDALVGSIGRLSFTLVCFITK